MLVMITMMMVSIFIVHDPINLKAFFFLFFFLKKIKQIEKFILIR